MVSGPTRGQHCLLYLCEGNIATLPTSVLSPSTFSAVDPPRTCSYLFVSHRSWGRKLRSVIDLSCFLFQRPSHCVYDSVYMFYRRQVDSLARDCLLQDQSQLYGAIPFLLTTKRKTSFVNSDGTHSKCLSICQLRALTHDFSILAE